MTTVGPGATGREAGSRAEASSGPWATVPLFPLLVAAYPVLALLVQNADQVPLSAALRPLLVAEGLTLALWLLVGGLYRSLRAAMLPVAFVVFAGMTFAPVADALSLSEPAWAFLLAPLVLAAVVSAPLVGSRPAWTRTLNLFGLFMVAMACAQLVWSRVGTKAAVAGDLDPIELHATTSPPDIYYILLDGYGSRSTLRRLYHRDNTEFLDALRALGFRVFPNGYSNYSQTQLVLASVLNMEYLDAWDLQERREEGSRSSLLPLVRSNRVVRSLGSLGYSIVALESGYPPAELRGADVFLQPAGVPEQFEMAVLYGSVAKHLLPSAWLPDPYEMHRRRVRYALEALPRVAGEPGPKFVFAHLLSPHPPFVFDGAGGAVTPSDEYQMYDGSHFPGSREEYIQGYGAQLEFVSAAILETITTLLAQADRPSVVIVQGDHGPGAYLDQDGVEGTDVQERMGILSAVRVPPGFDEPSAEDVSPVNTFRFVMRTLFDADTEALELRSYYSSWERPFDFKEVTGALENDRWEGPAAAGSPVTH